MLASEFGERLASLNTDAAETVPGPQRCLFLGIAMLAIIDGAKARSGQVHSTTEDEFVQFCRRVYRKARSKPSTAN